MAALACLGVLAGCSSDPAAESGGDTGTASHAATSPARAKDDGARTRDRAPSPPPDHEPVRYTPTQPEEAVRTARGHLVNSCVPEELRDAATTLTTSDGVHLSTLVLGSGPDGVLLDHEQGYSICSFLDIGKRLADKGYHVVIPEYRNHGVSEESEDNEHIDRDARAALAELRRVGAERVFLGGASCGGSTAAVAAVDSPLEVTGLLLMSSPAQCGGVDAEAAVKKITAPTLLVASPGDMNGAFEEDAREMYAASAARDKELVIDPSGYHGTDMIRRAGPSGAKLRTRVETFITDSFSASR